MPIRISRCCWCCPAHNEHSTSARDTRPHDCGKARGAQGKYTELLAAKPGPRGARREPFCRLAVHLRADGENAARRVDEAVAWALKDHGLKQALLRTPTVSADVRVRLRPVLDEHAAVEVTVHDAPLLQALHMVLKAAAEEEAGSDLLRAAADVLSRLVGANHRPHPRRGRTERRRVHVPPRSHLLRKPPPTSPFFRPTAPRVRACCPAPTPGPGQHPTSMTCHERTHPAAHAYDIAVLPAGPRSSGRTVSDARGCDAPHRCATVRVRVRPEGHGAAAACVVSYRSRQSDVIESTWRSSFRARLLLRTCSRLASDSIPRCRRKPRRRVLGPPEALLCVQAGHSPG